jgi:hypothetical protein
MKVVNSKIRSLFALAAICSCTAGFAGTLSVSNNTGDGFMVRMQCAVPPASSNQWAPGGPGHQVDAGGNYTQVLTSTGLNNTGVAYEFNQAKLSATSNCEAIKLEISPIGGQNWSSPRGCSRITGYDATMDNHISIGGGDACTFSKS